MIPSLRHVIQAGRIRVPIPAAPQGLRNPDMNFSSCARAASFFLFVILLSLLLGGCKASTEAVEHGQTIIEFTSVPMAGGGDPKAVSTIKGRVIGAQPGQKI